VRVLKLVATGQGIYVTVSSVAGENNRVECLSFSSKNDERKNGFTTNLRSFTSNPLVSTTDQLASRRRLWSRCSGLSIRFLEAARTIKCHCDGILRWFDSRIANWLIEGINSLVQAAKAKACGYRSIRNLKAMIYLLVGKLDLPLPARHHHSPPRTAMNPINSPAKSRIFRQATENKSLLVLFFRKEQDSSFVF
jgi:hypothetical protein